MRRFAASRVPSLVLARLIAPTDASANDKISFGLDWKAEADYGGYDQTATGIYAEHGLDVTGAYTLDFASRQIGMAR